MKKWEISSLKHWRAERQMCCSIHFSFSVLFQSVWSNIASLFTLNITKVVDSVRKIVLFMSWWCNEGVKGPAEASSWSLSWSCVDRPCGTTEKPSCCSWAVVTMTVCWGHGCEAPTNYFCFLPLVYEAAVFKAYCRCGVIKTVRHGRNELCFSLSIRVHQWSLGLNQEGRGKWSRDHFRCLIFHD